MARERYERGKARDTHFKSWAAWVRFTRYLHTMKIPHHKVQEVTIAGKRHKVNCPHCVR